ncbi:ATP-dependent DNA helicase [Streptomyces sp. BI20]|uniref:ATP-dependent DNA helicase n=1 Tax=Streptomyces sp. BI20 TaxID=3403460 RepID=UPI003C73226A
MAPRTPVLSDPEQLKELLGIPFTPEQMACVTAPRSPQVIVAGAGSGKTTVMAARVVWLVGTGQVEPGQVLGLTFTNKAAGELAERVRTALGRAGILDPDPLPGEEEAAGGEARISTYHAFAGQLLKDHGMRIGLEPTTRLLADATRFQLAARVLREAPGPFPALTRSVPDLVEELLALDGELSEHLVTPDTLRAYDLALLDELAGAKLTNADLRRVPDTARARLELLELVERYRQAKRSRDLIDFGDQIALSARLAEDRPEVGALLREEFRVVLLDEYQDTSVAQRRLLSALFGAGTEHADGAGHTGGGAGHAVTAVGDPCQAIYGWRGASVANLDDFPEHFPHADGRPADRFALSENRRSGGRLLTLANELAAPLRARHDGVEALRPAPDAEHDGTLRCALLDTHEEELEWLGDSVSHLIRTGRAPGEIAVLCRSAADFGAIQAVLVARDVPVEVVGLSGLLHLPEVADLVAVCEVLQDPGANAHLVRILTGPRWRIGPRDLALLGRLARRLVARDTGGEDRLAAAVEGVDPAEIVSLADALEVFLDGAGVGGDEGPGAAFDAEFPFSPEATVRFAHLARELRDLRRSLSDPLMDVLHRVLSTTGLDVELAASPRALAARRKETLDNFLGVAAGFAAVDGEAGLPAFLAFLRTADRHDKGLDNPLVGGENTVKVLTAHKSKGLEWDVVVVPGLIGGGFPKEKAPDAWTAHAKVLPYALRGDAATLPADPEWTAKGLSAFKAALGAHKGVEELRLGYVTFTRPRSLLLASGHWWGPTQKKRRGPSAFLDAVHDGPWTEVEAWAPEPEEDAQNPALDPAGAVDAAWPLPLDPDTHRMRRAAADLVEAYLARARAGHASAGAARAGEADADAHDAEYVWPPDCEEPDGVGGADGAGDGPPPEWEPDPWDADPWADATEAVDSAEATEAAAAAPDDPALGAPVDVPGEPVSIDPGLGLAPEERRAVESWDRDLDALEGELLRSRAAVREVELPTALSASQVLRLAEDEDAFTRELARPLPQPPQPAARRGTRFHAWVESRFADLPLPHLDVLDPIADLPGTDQEIADERDLERLKAAFEAGPYADRPPYRMEVPVQLTLAGRVIRGRIDAVYRSVDADGLVRWEIVDWKTGRAAGADPLQLAVYRLAWAEQTGTPPERITAAFHHVRTGRTIRPPGLPDRAALERILQGGPGKPDAELHLPTHG